MPTSDPHGELFRRAFDAFQAEAWHGDIEGADFSSRRGFEAAHSTYIADLEAQAQEIAVVRKLLEENRQVVDIYGEQLEAKDREIERLGEQNDGLHQAVLMGGRFQQEQAAEIERLTKLYNETLEDAEEFATLSRQAEQRETAVRRLLGEALQYLRTQEFDAATYERWLTSAENFLESKPLGSTVEGEE